MDDLIFLCIFEVSRAVLFPFSRLPEQYCRLYPSSMRVACFRSMCRFIPPMLIQIVSSGKRNDFPHAWHSIFGVKRTSFLVQAFPAGCVSCSYCTPDTLAKENEGYFCRRHIFGYTFPCWFACVSCSCCKPDTLAKEKKAILSQYTFP